MLKRKLVGMELNISKYAMSAQSVERAMRPSSNEKYFGIASGAKIDISDHIYVGKQHIGAYRGDIGHIEVRVPCIVPLGIVLE